MDSKYHFGVWDCLVIVGSLVVSASIGVWFRFSGGQQRTTDEYLLGGKDMAKAPVVFSFAVTIMSAVSMLGAPAEVYRYGAGVFVGYFTAALGMVMATYVLLPSYFASGVSSIYEYLEIRYGKATRYIVSALFIVQMVLYMAAVLYGPALALSAVTDLSMETSIVVFATVCTFYCSIGGLKAVLWTDVFQAVLMFVSLATIYGVAVAEVGGVAAAVDRAREGHRLNIFNFHLDLTTRHTVWNIGTANLVMGLGAYGTNQVQVQRLLSLSSLKRAQSAFLWSILPVLILIFLCDFLGVLLYAVFHSCDPVLNAEKSGVAKYDQLVPYFAVSRLRDFAGAAGACVAGIFSGSLSTISSAINSLATVTVIDFVQPLTKGRLSQRRLVMLSKGLAVLFGCLCVGFAFLLSRADSLLHATLVSMSVAEGPVCALFLVGMCMAGPTQRDALGGLFIGSSVNAVIGYGSLFSGYRYPPLPLSTSDCPSKADDILAGNVTCSYQTNCTQSHHSILEQRDSDETFVLFKTSFLWLHAIGSFLTAFFIIMPSTIRKLYSRLCPKRHKSQTPVQYQPVNKAPEVDNGLELFIQNREHILADNTDNEPCSKVCDEPHTSETPVQCQPVNKAPEVDNALDLFIQNSKHIFADNTESCSKVCDEPHTSQTPVQYQPVNKAPEVDHPLDLFIQNSRHIFADNTESYSKVCDEPHTSETPVQCQPVSKAPEVDHALDLFIQDSKHIFADNTDETKIILL